MEARIVTGYSKTRANVFRALLENKGYNVDVADPFAKERCSHIFNLTSITKSSTKNLVEITEKQLPLKDIDMLIGYSYGGAMAILQDKCEASKIVLLSPALAGNNIVWKRSQKILKKLPLPVLRDMSSQKLHVNLLEKLKSMKEKGTKIIFFLPCNEMGNVGDEKVMYTFKTLKELKALGEIYYIPVKKHRDMIHDPEIVGRIIERLNI